MRPEADRVDLANARESTLCQAETKVTELPYPPGKRLRCYIGLHKWVRRVNDEGGQYYACRYCGKYHETGKAIIRYPGSKP
jgi:hypothetical protein